MALGDKCITGYVLGHPGDLYAAVLPVYESLAEPFRLVAGLATMTEWMSSKSKLMVASSLCSARMPLRQKRTSATPQSARVAAGNQAMWTWPSWSQKVCSASIVENGAASNKLKCATASVAAISLVLSSS